jgi:hypothetical protein
VTFLYFKASLLSNEKPYPLVSIKSKIFFTRENVKAQMSNDNELVGSISLIGFTG